ncbi:site-specific recombinase [Paraburkholderia sp. MMS20-SJTR3]|uniref:Site-specific recombinase n=1 Tax=Paraburkholderia sejongensis TaxID=2886946 RepID=A0ABS8JQ00_9BURK|nr:site-specific recombinase [Paraburkholderia sp. MMS20-SJTR3]MCC8391956.1 site-specific recombinase [Paraburkholderia sp. MMS20-SJTR3]
MFDSIKRIIKKWRASRDGGHQLDALLAIADRDAPYSERSAWLIELAHWIRRGNAVRGGASAPANAASATEHADTPANAANATNANADAVPVKASNPAHTRIRYLLHVLDRNPAWKANVAGILRALLRESDGLSLLCDAGMPVHSGLLGAVFERVEAALIPPAPNRRELSAIVTLMFGSERDADWIDTLPTDLLVRIHALFDYARDTDEAGDSTPFSLDLLAALHNLTCQISSTGLSQTVRSRLGGNRDDGDEHDEHNEHRTDTADMRVAMESQPFYRLTRAMLALETAHQAYAAGGPQEPLLREVNYLRLLLDECRSATGNVFAHLYRNGVSVDIVFQVERMRMRIERAEHLLDAWMAQHDPHAGARLTAELVRANLASQSVAHLARSNFSLLARKVVEYSADTGEHYIARDRAEYLKMLRMAAGGGLVTVVTVCVKFAITGAHFQAMFEGLLAGINYAASFLLMHFLHFSLATKQPAMTAPTLARELDGVGTPAGVDSFVSSVTALMRTQAAAVLGNVLLVFPVCLGVDLLWHALFHTDLISQDKALATLRSFSLLGPTPFYAALTGVLLWSSSLLAGWADNWFILHRVGDALAYNRRLRLTLGAAGAARLARFCRSNVAGVVGNITLGLMLGLVPAILTAFAFSFEVRHVTLSAGSIGVALGVLGPDALKLPALWWAVAGVASMAILNVAVSFALAFYMAVKSRDLRRNAVRSLRGAIWQRLRRRPLELVWPVAGPAHPDRVQ